MNAKFVALFILIFCSACGNAEMTDARKDHLLAKDHGWIDLTINALSPEKGKHLTNDCAVSFSVNGEPVLRENANFVDAESKGNPIGYRFPVPAGQIDIEFTYSLCVQNAFVIKQPLNVLKDELSEITFDGGSLILKKTSNYNPTSLEWVRAQLQAMQKNESETAGHLSSTNLLIWVGLGFNLVVILLLWKGRRV